jgi:putative transcriptional regulator
MKKANILVATSQIQDDVFKKSVILMAEHQPAGALGFIINRPTKMQICDIFKQQEYSGPFGDKSVWVGGPVEAQGGVIISRQCYDSQAFNLGDNVYLSSTVLTMRTLAGQMALDAPDIDHPFKFLVGYAGWGPKQLDREIMHGSWIELSADDDLIFNVAPEKMWDEALLRSGVNPLSLVNVDPSYLH